MVRELSVKVTPEAVTEAPRSWKVSASVSYTFLSGHMTILVLMETICFSPAVTVPTFSPL